MKNFLRPAVLAFALCCSAGATEDIVFGEHTEEVDLFEIQWAPKAKRISEMHRYLMALKGRYFIGTLSELIARDVMEDWNDEIRLDYFISVLSKEHAN